MSSQPSSAQKAKMLALLQYLVPVSTLIVAGVVWFVMKDDFGAYLCAGLFVLAAFEFFTLRHLATKSEVQAQRDR